MGGCLQLILVMCFLELAAASSSYPSKFDNCQTKCGNVSIPFPFGIGDGCFYNNSWFEVECRTSRPFLKRANLEVPIFQRTDPQWEFQYIQVKIPVISRNCSAMNGVNEEDKFNLEGSPFFFSQTYNLFYAVGCNTLATLTDDDDKTVAGCTPTCDSDEPISTDNIGSDPSGNIVCYGIKCCQTTLPPYLQTFKPSFKRSSDDSKLCNSTAITSFVVDRGFVNRSTILEATSNPYTIASLVWILLDPQKFGIDNSTTECEEVNIQIRANGTFHKVTRFRCSCKDYSLDVNPHLPDGCSCSNNPRAQYCQKSHKSKAVIIGISSALGALVFLVLGMFMFKVLKKKISQKRKEKLFKRKCGLLLQQKLFSNDGRVEETKIFNSKELEKATDRFHVDRILGQGGQGTVYKGMLSDGRIVAVKKAKIIDEGSTDQFINEVVILSGINHRNVVKLFGCCLETDVPLLVYEFVPNGTLFQHIHDPNEEFLLTWEMRLQIATEIAGAFSYLHSAASLPIYHRDIKSTNILLDDKYKAKVADFGTSRSIAIDQTHMTTLVQGTFGYLDPEFFRSSQFTEKSDVYSFGVVMVELLTGRKPICTDKSKENRSLAALFVEAMEENELIEILDPLIIKEGWKEEMMVVADLARRCLKLNGKMRPTMKEVAVELEGIKMSRGQTTATQQTNDVVEYDDIDINGSWDTSSSLGGTCYYSTIASSLDAHTLLLNKP